MAATLSYSGTWTGLGTNLAPLVDTKVGAQKTAIAISPVDLTYLPDEIHQFIQMAAQGWGANVGLNVRLGYWATAALLATFLNDYVNAGVPRPTGGP